MPAFELQFPIEQVPEYAARYAYEDDSKVVAIGRAARERGHYTRDEFLAVCRWKTSRSAPLVALNSADSIEAKTRVALSENSTERERMETLRSLPGVDWATASVLLHLAYPERLSHPRQAGPASARSAGARRLQLQVLGGLRQSVRKPGRAIRRGRTHL